MSERNAAKIRKQIEILISDLQWFEEKHPGASLSWICNNLLHAYREICETPVDDAKIKALEDLTIFSLAKQAAKDFNEAEEASK